MALSSDEVRKLREEIEATAHVQKKVYTSVKDMAGLYGNIYKLSRNIKDAKLKNAKAAQRIAEIERTINEYHGEQRDKLEEELEIRNQIVRENNQLIADYEKQYRIIKKQGASLTNVATSIGGSIYKGIRKVWGEYQKFDKSARTTAISMGIGVKNVDNYRKSLNKAAAVTADWGVSYEDLAKMQGRYSDNLGRAVQLSDEGLEAISLISEGTLLGAEGAADLAAEMDRFGMSVIAAKDRVEETVNLAHKMGLNSTKVVKIMQQNLKLANKYNFREGTKNIMKMAANTAKFKLEMESVASMAEKLFEPEGAIEMAANLQVLGGEFSKLADPFKLMYMARNDMEGLQESIIKATAGVAQFNKKTGEFTISAQELHRLRYVAEATGIPLEQLAETARQYAKVDMAKKEIKADIDPDYYDFITSTAKWNQKKGGFVVTVYNEAGDKVEKMVKDLDNKILETNMSVIESLEERAKASKTFDETFANLIMKLKTALLPLLQGLDKMLRGPLEKLTDYLNREKIVQKLQGIAQKVGEFLVGVGKFIREEPVWAGAIGLGIMGVFKAVDWFMNGRTLGLGFRSVVGGLGGGGAGGGSGGIPVGGYGKGLSKRQLKKLGKKGFKFNEKTGMWTKGGKAATLAEVESAAGGGKWFRKLFKGKSGGGWGLAATVGLTLLNEGLQAAGAYRAGSGWDKGLSTASSTAEFATLGSMFGPWGTILGGIFGLGKGVYENYIKTPEAVETGAGYRNPYAIAQERAQADDFISRPGEGIQKINSSDTLIGAKKGGPIDKMLNGGGLPSNLTINFKPLKIEISPIELKLNGKSINSEVFEANPQLVRELSKMIQEEIRKAIGGGKLNPNVA